MKRNIAIVAGGDSSEHEVSLRSAAGILSFMDQDKYNCFVVEMQRTKWEVQYGGDSCAIDRNDFSFTASDGHHTFDFAYITIHGTPGENGILQGYFDLIGLPYSTSDVLVEALTFNKFALNNYLRAFGDSYCRLHTPTPQRNVAHRRRDCKPPRFALLRQTQCRWQQLWHFQSKKHRRTYARHRTRHDGKQRSDG